MASIRSPFSSRRLTILVTAVVAVVLAGGVFLLSRTSDSDAAPLSPSAHNSGDEPAETGGDSESPTVSSPPGVLPALDSAALLQTFDTDPTEPIPWTPQDWDVTVHSRDPETWDELDRIDAAHGPGCEPPPETHEVTSYDDAVFLCKNHMMTAIRGDAYGLVYLTPDHLIDFSEGEAVISLDISTLRTSVRDWWDVWITPYDDALQLPLDLDASADLSGPPRNSIRVGLGTENQVQAEIYEDFENVEFPDWPNGSVTGDAFTGYETFLEPDAMRRDTFEIHISATHLKVGMPDYDFWWIDTDIPELAWDTGVVQFGHHSYNPTKDCNIANNPRPSVDECLPNTWHWDNLSISPAIQFDMIRADERSFAEDNDTATLPRPAPEGAEVRFAGIGLDMSVSFDDGPWVEAAVRATADDTPEDHFASYQMEIPAGTTTIRFGADGWYAGSWHVRDVSVWTRPSP